MNSAATPTASPRISRAAAARRGSEWTDAGLSVAIDSDEGFPMRVAGEVRSEEGFGGAMHTECELTRLYFDGREVGVEHLTTAEERRAQAALLAAHAAWESYWREP